MESFSLLPAVSGLDYRSVNRGGLCGDETIENTFRHQPTYRLRADFQVLHELETKKITLVKWG